jgi:hypothetical protein
MNFEMDNHQKLMKLAPVEQQNWNKLNKKLKQKHTEMIKTLDKIIEILQSLND